MKTKIFVIALLVGSLLAPALPSLAAGPYTLAEVQAHATAADCWSAINGKVYDLTDFVSAHPGGAGAITGICGEDATAMFTAMHGSSGAANAVLAAYYIGDIGTAPAPDTAAPSVPANLTAEAVSVSQINLSWAESTDNVGVTGYNVYQNGNLIAVADTTLFDVTGLTESTTYSFTVAALDEAGNISGQSSPVSATTLTPTPAPDTTAPSTPAGLTAEAVSTSRINLNWTEATDNVGVTGYNVYQNGSLIGNSNTISFSVNGLTESTTYSFTVAAVDEAGNISVQSSTVSATTLTATPEPDTTAPSVPAGLTATAASASQINLSWTEATDNVEVTGYNVYRDGNLVGTATDSSFNNTGLTENTTYSFTVAAFDQAGNVSGQSASVSATTLAGTPTPTPDTTAPLAPTGVTAEVISPSQINLNWTASTDNVGVTGYNVYRNGSLVGTATGTSFNNLGLTENTAYSFTVAALDAAGNASGQSSPVLATTPAQTPTPNPGGDDDDEDEDEDGDDEDGDDDDDDSDGHHSNGHGKGHDKHDKGDKHDNGKHNGKNRANNGNHYGHDKNRHDRD